MRKHTFLAFAKVLPGKLEGVVDDVWQVAQRLSALVGTADIGPEDFDQELELRHLEDHFLDYGLAFEHHFVVLDQLGEDVHSRQMKFNSVLITRSLKHNAEDLVEGLDSPFANCLGSHPVVDSAVQDEVEHTGDRLAVHLLNQEV